MGNVDILQLIIRGCYPSSSVDIELTREKSIIYVRAFDEGCGCFSTSVESVLIIYVYQFCESECIDLKLQLLEKPVEASVKLNISHLTYSIVENELPEITTYCIWPIITVVNTVVAGLSAVARQIVKSSNTEKVQHLLGFRESCLMACSEASIWTMFCEVDMPQSLKNILRDLHFNNTDTIKIPNSLSRFEYHMNQPVRIHNMYKMAGIANNRKISMDIPKSQLNLLHTYAEGPGMTISDVILYPCIDIFFKLFRHKNLDADFPMTHNWYKNMLNVSKHQIHVILPKVENYVKVSIDCNFIKQSLYRSDMSHYKTEKKMYTKQSNIDKGLNIVYSSHINVFNTNLLYGSDVKFNWDNIPMDLNPCGGSLPEKRAERKCEQLESMTKSVIKIAGDSSYTIVDFCSGSGHLGLLLAYLLPNCIVILVENKEKSLFRAKERISNMGIKNVTLVQSNLDYFCADFDIGVALHACGTATDLVMQSCVKKQAHFVCCPCCYGGIKQCHLVDYPRSQIFSNLSELTYNDYMSLAHGADQTHDSENAKTKQGYLCMDLIDTDRVLYAESMGYNVFLGKLQPLTCTNKNNLIVGIANSQARLNKVKLSK